MFKVIHWARIQIMYVNEPSNFQFICCNLAPLLPLLQKHGFTFWLQWLWNQPYLSIMIIMSIFNILKKWVCLIWLISNDIIIKLNMPKCIWNIQNMCGLCKWLKNHKHLAWTMTFLLWLKIVINILNLCIFSQSIIMNFTLSLFVCNASYNNKNKQQQLIYKKMTW
jgi:hypothetical protein